MSLTPPQQALGLTALRLAPLVLSTAGGTFCWISHEFVAGFTHRDVPAEGRLATMPGWWQHIRAVSLRLIFWTWVPNAALGLLNASSSNLFGLLGPVRPVGLWSSRAYLLGGLITAQYFGSTFAQRLLPLNYQLMDSKEPKAERETALKEFLSRDKFRGLTAGAPAFVAFLVATTLWVSQQL